MICPICKEAISNPICLECMEKEVLSLINKTSLRQGIKEIKENLEIFNPNLSSEDCRCILCNKEVKICKECYLKRVFSFLKKRGLEEKIGFYLKNPPIIFF